MKRFRSHISILTKHLGVQHTDTSEKLVHRYSTIEQQTCFQGAFFRKGCPEVLQTVLGYYTWDILCIQGYLECPEIYPKHEFNFPETLGTSQDVIHRDSLVPRLSCVGPHKNLGTRPTQREPTNPGILSFWGHLGHPKISQTREKPM